MRVVVKLFKQNNTYQMIHSNMGRLFGDVLARVGRQSTIHKIKPNHWHDRPSSWVTLRTFKLHNNHDLLPWIWVCSYSFRCK